MTDENTIRVDTDEIKKELKKQNTINLDLNRHIDIDKYDTLPNFDLEEQDEFIDFETTANFFIDTSKGIDAFEEIDNENNLSSLENNANMDNRTHLEKKGYTRKVAMPEKNNKLKRKSSVTEQKASMKFYIILIIVAINICIVTFFIVFNVVLNNKGNNPNTITPTNQPDSIINTTDINDIVDDTANHVASIGIIENIAKSGAVQIYDLENKTTLNLKYVSSTKLYDQYNKPLIIDEFVIGEIVNFSYPNDKTNLVELSVSSDAFRENKLTNADNNTLDKTITFNNKTYNYNDKTLVVFDRGSYTIEEINDKDIVNIVGYKDTIYKLTVIKGHGIATFVKNNDIINGTIEIDNAETIKMEELTSVTLGEGAHKILVQGDNIDQYAIDIFIEPNKPTEVSLLLVHQKQGLFVPTITPSDFELKIDGNIIDTTKPILLDYGPHTITVTKENYNTFQSTITVSGQDTRMNIELEPKVLSSKLSISTNPIGANVYIDNVLVGVSPITQAVEYGSHTVLIKLDGYIEITYPVDVSTANPNPLYFPLQKSADILVP